VRAGRHPLAPRILSRSVLHARANTGHDTRGLAQLNEAVSGVRALTLLFACIAAAGCSSMHARQVAGLLDPYVGQSVSEVINRFGPPSDQYASSSDETTFEWSNFGAGQSGMNGCRVLVVALRTGRDAATVPLTADTLATLSDGSVTWIIKSWSSFGSGCR
jgi:hypothetical protein